MARSIRRRRSCLADLAPVRFTEDPAVIAALFGASDLWENPTAPKADATLRPVEGALLAARRRGPL
jgi:hypothetical protein